MTTTNRIFLAAIILFAAAGLLSAHPSDINLPERGDSSITERFAIYYKVDSIDINPTYLDNRRQIDHILHYLDKSPRIDSITIYAWASPEGPYRRNKWLSRERAKTAKAFLLKHSPDSAKLDSGKIMISPIAENWTGLEELVISDYKRKDRNKVLEILQIRKSMIMSEK